MNKKDITKLPSREFVLGVLRILPNCDISLRKTLEDEFYVLNNRCSINTDKKTVLLSSIENMVDFFGKALLYKP